MEKSIYDLELHECMTIPDNAEVMRVPGGWLYRYWDDISREYFGNSTFVPFNNEFQAPKQKELFETEKFNFKKSLIQLGGSEQIVSDYLKHRAKHKAANTETAFNILKKQLIICVEKKATIDDCILKAIEKSWRGFKADWYFNSLDKQQENEQQTDIKSW